MYVMDRSRDKTLAELNIHIRRWAAWAPGIEDANAWQQWTQQPHAFAAEINLPKPDIPPMLRRRLGTVGKIALHCALQCLEADQHLPSIFCSRHGELHRTVDMLADLAKQIALSPTSFSLSVHNANSGIFAIARHDQHSSNAISAGDNSLWMGLLEAAGMIAEGHEQVLVVVSDDPLPAPLQDFPIAPAYPYGAAFLVDKTQGTNISLAMNQPLASSPYPQALQLVTQLLNSPG